MTIRFSLSQHQDVLLNSHNIILMSNKSDSNFLMASSTACIQVTLVASKMFL